MGMKRALLLASVPLVLALAGCGPRTLLRPIAIHPQPGSYLASGQIASVQVTVADMNADRVEMLQRYNIPWEMQQVLTGLGNGPHPLHVQILITEFRNHQWGPARMHTQVQVMDQNGQTVRVFETDSTSVGSGRTSKVRAVAQDTCRRVAYGI